MRKSKNNSNLNIKTAALIALSNIISMMLGILITKKVYTDEAFKAVAASKMFGIMFFSFIAILVCVISAVFIATNHSVSKIDFNITDSEGGQ